jgi:uncharacterized protein
MEKGMTNEKYTLVTGGSMGIGKGMALECAARGHNLLLVALPGKELGTTALEIISKYGVEVYYLEIDLCGLDAPQKVLQWCTDNQYQVNFLINNAGIAGTSVFESSDPAYSDMRIMVNIRALVLLTRLFIPMLKMNKQSYVLNIGSLSAYFSIPYKAVYAASKAFVVQFSRAIKEELRHTGIHVSVVCPNGVQTNEGTFGRINAHGLMGRLTQISTTDLAKYSITRVYRKKTVIIPKTINLFLLGIQKLVPYWLETKLLRREFEKEVRVSF